MSIVINTPTPTSKIGRVLAVQLVDALRQFRAGAEISDERARLGLIESGRSIHMSISSRVLKGLICTALACALLPNGASGTEAATPAANARGSADDAARAQALLQGAVAHYKEVKDRALTAFSPKGEFVDGELYVYVISTAGVVLASGGPSSSVIGSNVADQADALGKPFIREMLDKAQANGSGTVEYRWLNAVDNKVERKIAYFQRIGDRIIAVGYYVARATPAQAQSMLVRAVDALRADPDKAIEAFNRVRGPYSEDDLYVFVIDLGDKRFRAHGVDRRLIGTDAQSLRDPNGKPILQGRIDAVTQGDQAELDYAWPNPVTGKIESKHTYLRKVNGLLVGVGYYAR